MKIDSEWAKEDKAHSYCIACRSEDIERCRIKGRTQYYCNSCGKAYDRWIKIDPAINWWIGDDGEYWHESSGVFVRDPDKRFLFYKRSVFPFLSTVPSGHVDKGERTSVAAKRELKEEVGLSGKLRLIATEQIIGDSCSRGSDAHVWHAFLLKTASRSPVRINFEGHSPVWVTLEEALAPGLTPPVEYIVRHYAKELLVA